MLRYDFYHFLFIINFYSDIKNCKLKIICKGEPYRNMKFVDNIEKAQETKNQSGQATQASTSTRQTIDLGKGIPANYEFNKSGRPTFEGFESETTGEPIND